MKRMPLNAQTKDYLFRMFDQYEDNKLLAGEAKQLFQDLYDTGLYLQMEPEVKTMVADLLRVQMITPKPLRKEFQ